MSEPITLSIDGKLCKAKEGETLLNIARANAIFVPAICYLTRCTPTLACRLCLVEANGKQVYACNTKAKEGMEVKTTTENIAKERRAIMEVYDVNHPLQCGVCDQSGECELQNYSLYMKVDSQSYSIKDVPRPTAHWGVMNYDPGLCIVCEKCVTVCKDMIGSNALSTVKRGSDAIEKSYKESMPKDAYSMWNKLNKSLISYDKDACIDCGECISVCPVGALVSHDFQYKSNAWELTKIPAANVHSADCALLYYECKHESIDNHQVPKIYRVTNEHHYMSLNGAARFGFEYANSVKSKDEKAFDLAISAFKNAKTIKFNSFITNEEAYILQKLKEKYSYKLVNNDAFKYQRFLKEFSKYSGSLLYQGSLKKVHKDNFVVSIGSYLKTDLPNAKYALNNQVVVNKGSSIYFHCIADKSMEKIGKIGKTTQVVYHKVNKEQEALLLLLDIFADENLPTFIKDYLDSLKEKREKTITKVVKETIIEKVLDENNEEKEVKKIVSKNVDEVVEFTYSKLFDDLNINENFLDEVESFKAKKDSYTLIVGEDLINSQNWQNLAKLSSLVQKYTPFDVLILPTSTNTLGVSLICDLDEKEEGLSIGYNEKATFELSALGDANLDMPALNQQEGTFVNVDKKVIPTNQALPYKGYVLNDIANELLDEKVEYTINYTKQLGNKTAFLSKEFDSLTNYFSNDQMEHRGYDLENITLEEEKLNIKIQNDEVLLKDDEFFVYEANPINQFNEFTACSRLLQNSSKIEAFASLEFLNKYDLQDKQEITICVDSSNYKVRVFVDDDLSMDNICCISTFKKNSELKKLFEKNRFNIASIKKA